MSAGVCIYAYGFMYLFFTRKHFLLPSVAYQNSSSTAACCVVEDVVCIASLRECCMLTVSPEMHS